jgi:hypothetical protein
VQKDGAHLGGVRHQSKAFAEARGQDHGRPRDRGEVVNRERGREPAVPGHVCEVVEKVAQRDGSDQADRREAGAQKREAQRKIATRP